MGSAIKKIMLLAVLLSALATAKAFTAIETYQNQLQGSIQQGNVLEIKDDKFSAPLNEWNKISNRTVNNIITFELYREGGTMPTIAFKCEVDLKVEYWPQYGQDNPITVDEHLKLKVSYSPTEGVSYSAADTYKFRDGYKVRITVNSITSAELGTSIPPVFRLMGQVVVERSYEWVPTTTIIPAVTLDSTAVNLLWNKYDGAEEYDLEWTFIDELSDKGKLLAQQGVSVTNTTLAGMFRNNATRVTIPQEYYEITLVHASQYLLTRIRAVQYADDGFRKEGNWQYRISRNTIVGPAVMLLSTARHRPNLNWHYNAVYAEGGMKKEVVSYFDGTLRNRQTVTVNNSDKRAVVQETLFDEFGRPLVNVLPAPIAAKRLNYYPGLHRNTGGGNYTYTNVYGGTAACIGLPDKMKNDTGAARYYSPANVFLKDTANFNIPDANGYPFAVNLYTPDNTNRVSVQGGVGEVFQPGNRATRMYYAKPEQWELDRMFGNDAGYASHYLKNMVVDGNGQVSVSYLNAAGKTVATALAGSAPDNLDGLASKPAPKQETFLLLQPDQFTFDPAKLKITATTTYSVAVPDSVSFSYNVNKLIKTFDSSGVKICSNCYYDLRIRITDNCNQLLINNTRTVGNLVSSCNDTATATGVFKTYFGKIGEYYVSFELGLDEGAIANYTDDYIARNTHLKTQWQFVQAALQAQDFKGCVNDCKMCLTSLGAKADFTTAIVGRLTQQGVTGAAVTTWSNTLYDSLLAECQRLRANCQPSPCEDLENNMKLDVSPGGQYALFDGDSALERGINVLFNHWREEFPVAPGSTTEDQFDLEGGGKMSPYTKEFTLTMLLKYWRPEWAGRFVKYHPEYCALRFCNDYRNNFAWDDKLRDIQTVAEVNAMTGGTFRSDSSWLADRDPVFGGILSGYKATFLNRMGGYSNQHLGISQLSRKNLEQYVDYMLYCNDNRGNTNTTNNPAPRANNWNSCNPSATCRVTDREWQFYRDKYLELKEYYYQMVRSNASYCESVCAVGDTLQPIITECPSRDAITIEPVDVVNNKQRVKVSVTGTPLSRQVVVKLYYPAEYSGLNKVTQFTLPPGKLDSVISIDTLINVQSIKVAGVDCSAWLPTPPVSFSCSQGRSQFALEQGGANRYQIRYIGPQTIPAGVSIYAKFRYVDGSTEYRIGPFYYSGANLVNDLPASVTNISDWDMNDVEGPAVTCINNSGGGGTSGADTVPPTRVPQAGCDPVLLYKISRVTPINYNAFSSISKDTVKLKITANAGIALNVSENCEAQADLWMQRLEACLNSNAGYQAKAATLRAKLIAVCKLGGDVNHPNGSSTIPGTAPAGEYASFKDAISGVLGAGSYNLLCNPWILDPPYPYQVKLQATSLDVQKADSGICARLSALTQEFNNAGGGNFYNWLVAKFGDGMTMTQAELTSLQKGCSNCRYILAKDMQLPVFFDPGAKGYINGTEFQNAKLDMAQETLLTLADTNQVNYETIFATYLNHKWGFTLSYADYRGYQLKLDTNPSAVLVNRPAAATVTGDPYSCVKELADHAAMNGIVQYNEYIAEEQRKFRKGYIAYCSTVKANLQLKAPQQLYHFTLYYYDQAGNLVRTVPPEGVHLLDAAYQQQIRDARDNKPVPCIYNGPVANADKNVLLDSLSGAFQGSTAKSLEMWLYNAAGGSNQVLATTGGKKYLLNTCLSGQNLYMSVYSVVAAADGASMSIVDSRHVVANIEAVYPLRTWTHVVLQGAGLFNSNLAVYVNGIACPLTTSTTAGCGWSVAATASGVVYPESLTTLKHLRIYKRLLSGAEVTANATVSCFGLSPTYETTLNNALTYWGRYNTPAGGAVETQEYGIYPGHTLVTSYGYQSLNGLTAQRTPDAGVSRYWYDTLGRLTASQNAEQQAPANGGTAGRYSYTKYDAQGRVTEVGEKAGTSLSTTEVFLATPSVFLNAGTNAQITRTFYDEAYAGVGLNQENLRKRVSASTYQLSGSTPSQATYYSYDQVGNVKTLWQQVEELGLKRVDYQYDLVSGKVNKVRYQRGGADRFFYNYQYDAENRLTKAGTGIDTVSADGWEIMNPKTDARYYYYLHGPLSRMELGNVNLVQGVDYAYTLQGWLKGVNGTYFTDSTDMGRDGYAVNRRSIGRDAYGYSLDYYTGDYKAINKAFGVKLRYDTLPGDVMGRDLYNGNISRSTLALAKINGGVPVGYSYRYDQLNRLTGMRQHSMNVGVANWSTVSVGNAYKENISYDGNGNILRYTRYGSGVGGKQLQMDSLKYVYAKDGMGYLSSNKLTQVLDSIAGDPYTEDITSQGVNNYIYDKIGNLMRNTRDSVTGIKWTVYGKISNITKADGSSLEYRYDPSGNRVYKGYTHDGITDKTWYVRDAQGNTLAVYGNRSGGSDKYWKEMHLYGSSRLGVWEPGLLVGSGMDTTWNKVGLKRYELTNHLGNVLVTVSDKAIRESGYYRAEVLSAGDYYPFGMGMMDRKWSLSGYRYGFNGKENDGEVKGEGNEQDYGMRVYDPRVGRFLSVDPLSMKFPWYTPYQFAGNTPIQAIDLDGTEEYHYSLMLNKNGTTSLQLKKIEFRKEHSFMGYTWTTPIYTKKAVVNYQGANYYIGFAGSYGRGNENGMALFEEFKKNPVAQIFPQLFLNEKQSYSVEQMSMAVEMQTNTAMYGPLSAKAWYTANQSEKPGNSKISRAQGGVVPNSSLERIMINDEGRVSIKGNKMLYIVLDDDDHSVYFYQKRGGANAGAYVASFEIPQSLADDIRKNAVPQAQGKLFPNMPQQSDPTKSTSAYGLPKEYIKKLREQAVQGTGKKQAP